MNIVVIKFADCLLIYPDANPFNNPLVIREDYGLIRMDTRISKKIF